MIFDQTSDVFKHLRGLAQKDAHFHVDGFIFKVQIFEHELPVVGRFAYNGDGAALASAERGEGINAVRHDGHDVALLGFVAPNLHGRHGRIFVVDIAEVEAPTGGFDELRETVGEPACADIVNREYGVIRAECDTAIDHLLTATLHFWVAALDGVKIEGFGLRARSNGGSCAAA